MIFNFRKLGLLCLLLCVAGCSVKEQEKAKELTRPASTVLDKTTLLATIADDEKPPSAATASGGNLHPAASTGVFSIQFSASGGGVAYKAQKSGKEYVVHNGVAGRPYASMGFVPLSPDGKRVAYGALENGTWCMVVDGTEGARYSTVKSPLFSPDGKHVAYQAMKGEKWHLVVDTTPDAGTQTRILDHQFSGDSLKIAYIDNADDKNSGRLVVSDLAFSKQQIIGTGVSRMILNESKTKIAAISNSDNKQRVIECSFDRPDALKSGLQYDAISNLAFGSDSVSLVYEAVRGGKRLMVLNGKEEALPDGDLKEKPVIRPGNKGVGAIIAANNLSFLQHFFLATDKKEKEYEEVANLVYTNNGSLYAYVARNGQSWFVVVNGLEGPLFDKVVTPQFSPDGKYLVYRARKDGKRFVVVADTNAKTLKTHQTYEQVFDVLFAADGKSVGYGVKDGNKLIWKVERL